MALWQFGRARPSQGKGLPQRAKSRSRRKLGVAAEPLEQRLLLSISPTLVSIISDTPNEGDLVTNNVVLHQAPQQLTFRFDSGQTIDASTLATGLQITRSGNDGVFGNGNDVVVATGYVGLLENSNEVVVRFLNSLPDDTYRLTVVGTGAGALKNTQGQAFNNGANSVTTFRLDLGAQVLSVVPQPITRNASGQLVQVNNQIVVYFNGDTLNTNSAQDPSLYQLIYTNQSATNNDDVVFNPTSVVYNPANNSAVLTFSGPLSTLVPLGASGVATYRLRIGDNSTSVASQTVNVSSDSGSSFATSTSLGALGNQTKVLTGAALDPPGSSPTNAPYGLRYPGGPTDPGQRDIFAESHINGFADSVVGISKREYNFKSLIGTVNGNDVFNQITEAQKQRVREVFEMYGYYLGVKFVETPSSGLTIATGDLRALDPDVLTGPGGVGGLAGSGKAIMDNAEDWGNSEFGGAYFTTAMHEIGHLLGLGHSYEAPPLTVQGDDSALATQPAEPVFPGDFDLLGAKYLFRPEGKDIDLYSFTLNSSGRFSAETVAERLSNSSLADTVITLYDSQGNIIARNDDYFSSDSFVDLKLGVGTYYVAVTSTGNTDFNPKVLDSGFGGTTEGPYTLRLNFVSDAPNTQLLDTTGTALDGDGDGEPGGNYNFWFNVGDTAHTIFVDKTAPAGGNGAALTPFNKISDAINKASDPSMLGPNGLSAVIRVVGNGGADGNVATLADNKAYEIGLDIFNNPLSDGATLNVPKGATLVVDAGAIFKLRQANINAGSFAQGIDLSRGSIQVLGTPFQKAYFTSYNNEAIGVDTNPLPTTPAAGDWSGFVFQNDSDLESNGIFVNYLAFADIGYGGGATVVNSVSQSFDPIDLVTSRPSLFYNSVHDSAGAAISANPDSFEVSVFADNSYTADYGRSGPNVHGNVLKNNSTNGLFVRIRTQAGTPIDVLDVTARFSATDIVYVLTENLLISGTPGGPVMQADGSYKARLDASLAIDPGVIVKLQGSRIEVGIGAQLIAEGNAGAPVVFTSLSDDTHGAGGVYDTTGDGGASLPSPGDWGGLDFDPVSKGSIDHALIQYAGGVAPIEGGFARFNPVEIRQANVRITNSTLENNASGGDNTDRNGRGSTTSATIFVRGAQPIIVGNLIFNNAGDALSVNANAMTDSQVVDWGRSTGSANIFTQYANNYGPMVRNNVVTDNDVNGLTVRGATLTRGSIWDDTDIVHVLRDDIDVPNFESIGGLRLQSSPTASLVIKLLGGNAGFTANGKPLDITDRIGGSVQVLGSPGHAVIMTSLNDSTVGAGFDLDGNPQVNTLGNGLPTVTTPSKLNIQFVSGPGIVSNPAALAVFQQAAAAWEAVLDDPITLTFDINMASLGAGTAGLNTSVENIFAYDDVRNHMIADAGANEAIVNQLPTFAQLTATLPPGDSVVPFIALSNANALALGYSRSLVTKQTSAYDGVTEIDASIEFNLDLNFDYDRTDGLTGTDFLATVMHEIGHALGFSSSVDSVDSAPVIGPVALTPLDLFRVAPGTGATNFTNTPRIMTPGQTAVFYDGGQFKNASLGLSPFVVGDIPMSTGKNGGDGNQASHWKNRSLLGSTTAIGIMDPIVVANGVITQADTRAMDLIGWNAVNRGAPGDWNGINLTQYSNDRNVAVINELEPANTGTADLNHLPATAQFLGSLAPSQQSGDENNRLGFEVHGAVSFDQPGDADVYSFSGVAGTQVWFDIDKTSSSLDTVVELINANGNVLAASDNSVAEGNGTATLVSSPTVTAFTLNGNEFSHGDLYTLNLKDAGMRLALPGTVGTVNTYYIRVRSSSGNLSNLTGGQTSGMYQLQVRLQDADEIPGSTVRFADIRYATNGITVSGLPGASPLGSTSTRVTPITNTTLNAAQDLGNLLDSDQNMLSVSSALLGATDIDWYKFTLTYQDIQSIGGSSAVGHSWSTVFDIDYADGLSRPDLTLSVFDSLGNLIFISNGSNVADDQPTTVNPTSQADLSRGTSGKNDPYLGSIQLPEGTSKTYYVAVTSTLAAPTILSDSRYVRLEPVNGVTRIVEDHIGSTGYSTNPVEGVTDNTIKPTSPAILPINNQQVANPDPRYPGTTVPQLSLNVVPFELADLNLYVSQHSNQQTLWTVNPSTNAGGAVQPTRVGNLTTPGTGNGISDIVIRSDGVLMAAQDQNAQGETDNTGGRLVAVDPTDGQVFPVGRDGLPNYVQPTAPAVPQRDMLTAFDVGAIAYKGIGVGDPLVPINGEVYEPYQLYEAITGTAGGVLQSYLFVADPITGNAKRDDNNPYTIGPVGGSVWQGYAGIFQDAPGDMGITTGMAYVTSIAQRLTIPAASSIIDGQFFTVTDSNKTVTFEFDNNGFTSGSTRVITYTGTETAAQMATLVAAAIASSTLNVAPTAVGDQVSVLNAFGANGGNSLVTTFNSSSQQLYGVSDTGKLFTIRDFRSFILNPLNPDVAILSPGDDPNKGLATQVTDFGGTVQFAGLALGPQNLDLNGDGVGGDLANTLFGITSNGDLYAIDPLTGTFRVDVFPSGATHINVGVQGVTGLAFSPLDLNLWHPTQLNAASLGHGITSAPDNSRPTAGGGTSYYFGFENLELSEGSGYIDYTQNTQFGPSNPNAQFGVQSTAQQNELTRNSVRITNLGPTASGLALAYSNGFAGSAKLRASALIGNNYNMPGGAHGDLITNSFSLAGYSPNDMPVLYLNYYADGTDSMTVTVSVDNGATWKALAGGAITPATTADGVVDTTWRQYHGDLSPYAGQGNVQIKFGFASGIADNNHTGFMIDDIIVGFAERGQMVTYTPLPTPPAVDTTFSPFPAIGDASTVTAGAYQLQIRRGQEYSGMVGDDSTLTHIYGTGDTNDRSINGFTLQASGGYALYLAAANNIADGETFTIADGGVVRTFEFDNGNGVGSVAGVANTAIRLVAGESKEDVGRRIVQAINNQVQTPIISTGRGIRFASGDVFSVQGTTQTARFQFTKGPAVQQGFLPILFTGGESADAMSLLIEEAINSSGLDVVAVAVPGTTFNTSFVVVNNSRKVDVGTSPLGVSTLPLTVSATLDLNFGRVYIGGLADPTTSVHFDDESNLDWLQETFDGQNFTVDDGIHTLTFEFDSNNSVTPGNVAVPFTTRDVPATIAAAINTAINSKFGTNFKVSATNIPSSDRVDLSGAAFVDRLGPHSIVFAGQFQAVGDQNVWRPQGEVILQGNQITNAAKWGIQVLPGTRDGTGSHPGAAANLAAVNTQRLAPGIVIANNIVDSAGTGGILYSGDPNGAGLPNAVVPFGRIINNTIYGAGTGYGIAVTQNASPTLLNNIVAGLSVGIAVDSTSTSTVVGGTLYQGNGTNVLGTTLGSFAITPAANAPLFVNAAAHNFNLLKSNASGLPNQAIDSSLNSLQDRQAMITLDSPLGIAVSPMIAPTTDLTGKVRVDDPSVNPPFSGLGSNVYIDRGALDRSDFAGPLAALLNPVDNDSSGNDQDPSQNNVMLVGQTLADFRVQLSDSTGSGIDDSTVTAASFALSRNGAPLVLGVDYTFSYDATNNVAKFTPLVGIWQSNFIYTILVDNTPATGIKDLAGNSLLPTDLTGVTKFTIGLVPVDFGDAPSPYPTVFADNGARHVLSNGLRLGATATSEPNGQPSADANSDTGDDGVVFNSVFMSGTTATLTVTASQAGKLDAFIDWNGDGDWNDAGEQIFASQSLVAGANVLQLSVPSTIATTTFARFRVSTAGGLGPTGLAIDGEVEDYKVSITPPVEYTTKLFNATTGVELLKDSTGAYVALAGTTIQARVYVNDLRSVGAAGGVFSAFADLTRDNAGITWGSLVISANFPSAQSGVIDGVNQIVDEAGGLAGLTPTGAGTPRLLFTVNGALAQALTPGTVINVTPDAADQILAHPTTIYGSSDPVSASYVGAKMIIPIHPWQNPANRLDVDGSGVVVPLDALLVINALNQGLGGPLPQSPVPPNIPAPYLDVNGDGNLTPIDALLIISFLNQQPPLVAGGAPPAAQLSATAGGAPPAPQAAPAVNSAADQTPVIANSAVASAAPVATSASSTETSFVTTSTSAAPAGFASFLSSTSSVVASTAAVSTGATVSVAQVAVTTGETSRVDRSHTAPGSNGGSGGATGTLQERILAQLFGSTDDEDALELADVGPRLENAWNQAKSKWRHG